jgi:hypothetical protein
MTETVFQAQEGRVLYRGTWLPLFHARPLLDALKPQGWAAELADQLEHAIEEATDAEA